MRALALVALAACASVSRGPRVVIHLVDAERWSESDRRYVASVSSSWRQLAMRWEITDDAARSLDACPADWHAREIDCSIDVGLIKVDGLGLAGMSDRATSTARIDASISGLYLLHVVAHEVGHIVLDTWRHLPSGTVGIMASGSGEWGASRADLALACERIGRGCE